MQPCHFLKLAGQASAVILALASLETGIGFVDDIDATLAADNAAILVAFLQCLQRASNTHVNSPSAKSSASPTGGRYPTRQISESAWNIGFDAYTVKTGEWRIPGKK